MGVSIDVGFDYGRVVIWNHMPRDVSETSMYFCFVLNVEMFSLFG